MKRQNKNRPCFTLLSYKMVRNVAPRVTCDVYDCGVLTEAEGIVIGPVQ